MNRRDRMQLGIGLLLVLLGVWFLAVRQVPALKSFIEFGFEWPVYVIAAGAVILLVGLLTGAPE